MAQPGPARRGAARPGVAQPGAAPRLSVSPLKPLIYIRKVKKIDKIKLTYGRVEAEVRENRVDITKHSSEFENGPHSADSET